MPNPLNSPTPYAQDGNALAPASENMLGGPDMPDTDAEIIMQMAGKGGSRLRRLPAAPPVTAQDLMLQRLPDQRMNMPWLYQLYQRGMAPDWFNQWMQYLQPRGASAADWQLLHGGYPGWPGTRDVPYQPDLSTQDRLTQQQWGGRAPGAGIGVPVQFPTWPRTTQNI